MSVLKNTPTYAGRLAPSPTGYLHLGHARTFWIAAERAAAADGQLLLRMDDLDRERCRPEFRQASLDDLAWLGLKWEEPVIVQSERVPLYRQALETLHAAGLIFPCNHSRRDVREAAGAPHDEDDEPIYPVSFRPDIKAVLPPLETVVTTNWRFRVPVGRIMQFIDSQAGLQTAVAGTDFGDFLVWRKDNLPSYQLASVVDDIAMGISEVVRGADLIRSTFRQQLLFEALGQPPPKFHHCRLMLDEQGKRMAKRHDSMSLRSLRAAGVTPAEILRNFATTK